MLTKTVQEIEALHEQVTQLKTDKRKLMQKLQIIKKGVLDKVKEVKKEIVVP